MSETTTPPRRFRRIPVQMSVRLSTIDPEPDPRTGRPFFRASREVCANLSEGGALLRTRDPLSPGRRVLVEISLPGNQPIEAVGRVAWSRTLLGPEGKVEGNGVGVEFLDENCKDASLQRFLARYGDTRGD